MKLSELLETKNAKEQEQRVTQLIARVQNPVIHLAVSYDPLSGESALQVIGGGQVPAEVVIQVLAAARDALVSQVAEARAKQVANPAPEPAEED
ncbi:hypothetical protein SY88_23630 [Clostridiales bacterium PH28_bin88]|nr:hypothetical protein SY88_23630 [Clostridiales bacterium PH28_bin88]